MPKIKQTTKLMRDVASKAPNPFNTNDPRQLYQRVRDFVQRVGRSHINQVMGALNISRGHHALAKLVLDAVAELPPHLQRLVKV